MQFVKLLALLVSFSLAGFASDSPFTGSWKLNTSKSHQIPTAIKSSTAHIQADERTFKLSQDFVDDKDQLTTVTFDAKLDGKDYPMHGEEPDVTSGSLTRVNDHHIILTSKKDGKVLYTNDMTVSTDGKTLTGLVTDFTESTAKKGTVVFEKEN
jgi:hypothetical protein